MTPPTTSLIDPEDIWSYLNLDIPFTETELASLPTVLGLELPSSSTLRIHPSTQSPPVMTDATMGKRFKPIIPASIGVPRVLCSPRSGRPITKGSHHNPTGLISNASSIAKERIRLSIQQRLREKILKANKMKERQPIKTAFLPTNDADDISSSSLQEDIEDMAKANVASRRGRKSHLERSICTLGASLDLPSPPPCTLTKGSFSRKPTRRIAPNLPMMVVPVSVEESFYFNMDQLKAFTQDQPRSTLAMEESSPLADQFGFLNFSSPTSRPATSPSALSMGSNGMFLDELERQREEMENQLMGESSDGGPTHPDLDQYFALPSISSTDGQLSLYDDIFVGI